MYNIYIQGAAELNHPNRNSDLSPSAFQCKSRLIQISSPANIPLQDMRWQELFLSYDILVHLDLLHPRDVRLPPFVDKGSGKSHGGGSAAATATAVLVEPKQGGNATDSSSLVAHVVRNMAKNAVVSSNLAGLAWHTIRMLNELMQSCRTVVQAEAPVTTTTTTPTTTKGARQQTGSSSSNNMASRKIALVGQARVVCGALNFFRLVLHEAMLEVCSKSGQEKQESNVDQNENHGTNYHPKGQDNDDGSDGDDDGDDIWEEILSLRSTRQNEFNDSGSVSLEEKHLTKNLIRCLFTFLTSLSESKSMQKLVYSTAELYDVTVFCLKLVLVLCSTQLYSPMVSSYQRLEEDAPVTTTCGGGRHYFLDEIMQEASTRTKKSKSFHRSQNSSSSSWTPQGIMLVCLNWIMGRPRPPERSISHHVQIMADMIATQVKQDKMGKDGMYETHTIVMANAPGCTPQWSLEDGNGDGDVNDDGNNSTDVQESSIHDRYYNTMRSSSGMILDSTKKVIHLSSTLILLPIRLLVVALRALRNSQKLLGVGKALDYDSKLAELQSLYNSGRMGSTVDDSMHPSLTNDVLWLSDSPMADLGACLFLILTNNHRAGVPMDRNSVDGCYSTNPFRIELASMDDNRWEGYSKTPDNDGYLGEATDIFETVDLSNNNSGSFDKSVHHYRNPKQNNLMTINFEHLFHSFSGTVHNEVGALVLYTLLQASPIFAASLAVRSDLDKVVLPLLRTLYYSTSISHYISGRTTVSANDGNSVNVLEQPFRSRSQLYVIMILLLIFSQDASFGPDAFKRSTISNIEWYKERQLKNISVGSVIILSMLRCITFNLNRLNDPFLLSNCCAVLLNLSPNVVELNSYTALRLVSVLIATMKRYTILVMKNGGKPAEEGDVTSTLGMYAEACRILLQVVKHGVRRKVVESNLHLVYSLAYNQREFNTIIKSKGKFFTLMIVFVDTLRQMNVFATCACSFILCANHSIYFYF
jgi:Dyggve-Melchior-Clausen syndrome protein.